MIKKNYAYLLTLLLVACRHNPTSDLLDATSTPSVLESEAVRIGFSKKPNSISWTEFLDKKSGSDLINGSSVLFRIDYNTAAGSVIPIFNHSKWDRVGLTQNDKHADLTFESAVYGKIDIKVDLIEDRLEWQLDFAEAAQSTVSVERVVFPIVEVAPLNGDGTNDQTFFPERFGRVIPNMVGGKKPFRGAYPSGGANIPLMGTYDSKSGIYFSDGTGSLNPRSLLIEPIHYATHSRLLFQNVWLPPFKSSGKQIARLLHGDWFDAALAYREQVKRTSPERFNRPTVPTLQNVGFWISEACSPKDPCIDRIKAFQAELKLPLIFHWYVWHQIPFDDEYPAFLPARQGFTLAVADLAAHNVSTMPYINANLWDSERSDFDPADAVMDRNGKLITFSKTKLAQICPSSTRFHSTIKNVVKTLSSDHHVAGIYLDQLSAVDPVVCHNPAHNHAYDTPTWWLDRGHYLMVNAVEDAGSKDSFITSEWANEAFVGKMDGMLVNNYVPETPIPLFNAVYNEAVRTFGRFQWKGPDMVKAYRMKLGQTLVFGSQLGWLDSALLEDPDIRAMSIGQAQLRHRYKNQFNGRMLRPPFVEGNVGEVSADWDIYWTVAPLTLPAVLAGSFESDKNNAISVFVNIGEIQKTLDCGERGEVKDLSPGQAVIFERHIEKCTVR